MTRRTPFIVLLGLIVGLSELPPEAPPRKAMAAWK